MAFSLRRFLEKFRFTNFHHLRYFSCVFIWLALLAMCNQRVSLSIAIIGFATDKNVSNTQQTAASTGGAADGGVSQTRSDETDKASTSAFSLKNMIISRSSKGGYDKCPNRYLDESTSADKKTQKVFWKGPDQEFAVAFYSAGYLSGHVPGTLVTFYTGIHVLMIIIIFSCSLLTLAIVWSTKIFNLVLLIRLLQGFIMGGMYPAINQAVAVNSHKDERHMVHMFIHTANFVSSAMVFPLGGYLIQFVKDGWKYVFVFTASLGFFGGIFWTVLCWSEPSENPFMSKKEIDYIENSLYPNGRPPKKTIWNFPWRKLASDPQVPINMSAHSAKLAVLYMNLLGAPGFFKKFYKLGPFMAGVYGVIPFMGECILQLSYSSIMLYILPKSMSKTTERKLHTLIGCVGCSFFLFISGFIDCDNLLGGIILQTLSLMFVAPYQYGYFLGIVERYGPFSGIAFTIINIAGSASGLVQRAILISLMKNFGTVLAYQWSFILTSLLSVILVLPYLIFGRVDQPSWVHGRTEAVNTVPLVSRETETSVETGDDKESNPEIHENDREDSRDEITA